MSEKDLIKGCIRDEPGAQKELFQRYAERLFTVCRRYARHRMEAEDMLQDAFIRIINKIHTYKGEGSLERWLRSVTVRTALSYFQKTSFQQDHTGLDQLQEIPEFPTILSQMQEEELLELISQLPDGYRVVFNLHAIEGYSHKEIAQILGTGESTSRSQLTKARKMLQTQVIHLQKIRL